jgi:acyl carrier protein
MNKDATLAEVIAILRRVNADKPAPILPGTRILAELDLDSLKMIELMDALKARYGVDFGAYPQSLDDLRTPETIAAALIRAAGP